MWLAYKPVANLLYTRIAERLRAEIDVGRYEAGILPTEAQLGERFDASRSTVRKALQVLRGEGLIVSRQGSGWRVTPTVPRMRLRVQASGEQGSELTAIACRHAVASNAVVSRFRIPAGSELLLVERVAVAAGVIVHRSETWFAPQVAPGLDHQRAKTEPPALLLSRLGHPIAGFEQFAEAVLSDTRDEEVVGVPPNSPILRVTRVALGENGLPLFLSLHRHPGSSTRVDLSLPTTDNPDGPVVSLTPEGC